MDYLIVDFFKKSLKQINSLFECSFAWNILKGITVNVWIDVSTTTFLLQTQAIEGKCKYHCI